MVKPRKKFCKYGHDISIVGRTRGHCRGCYAPVSAGIRPRKKAPPKQICSKNHNMDIVGKDSQGHCKECKRIYDIEYRKKNILRLRRRERKYAEKHKRHKKEYDKKYRIIHQRDKNIQMVQRRLKDTNFKLAYYLRIRLRQAIKNNQKIGSAVRDLGCSISFFKQYIESKFYGDMTWDNWGTVWELDHIQELCTFDLTIRKQFLKAIHYKNYQPLTIPDHKKKTIKERRKRIRQNKTTC